MGLWCPSWAYYYYKCYYTNILNSVLNTYILSFLSLRVAFLTWKSDHTIGLIQVLVSPSLLSMVICHMVGAISNIKIFHCFTDLTFAYQSNLTYQEFPLELYIPVITKCLGFHKHATCPPNAFASLSACAFT